MATVIKTKNGSGAPLASDLVQGELAIDLTNKRLYTENASGTVIELGTVPSTIDINAGTIDGTVIGGSSAAAGSFTTISASGEIAANGGVAFGDNDKATFGASDDLQIYHDGSNSYISDVGTGGLTLKGDTIEIQTGGGNKYFQGFSNVARLYHTNAEKLATTATGINVTGTVTADGLTVDAAGDVAFGTKFFWDASAESLGIGTSSPQEPLHVTGNIRFGDTAPAEIYTNSSELRLGVDRNDDNVASDITFYVNNSEKVRIDSSGNVGIGTSSPSQALSVESSSPFATRATITNTGNAAAGSGILLATKNGATQVSAATLRTDNAGNFSIFTGTTSTTERVRIDSSGNLLVGTTSTDMHTTSTGTGVHIGDRYLHIARNSNPAAIFNRITSDGDIVQFRKDGTAVGSISVTSSATAYNTSSDYRLKENVVEMEDASSRVLALNPVRFNFIADPDKTVDGFIAHEAQEVVPEAVTGAKDAVDDEGNPEYQGIDQSKLVPLLTKALQEALTEIESLKARVAALEV